MIRQSLRIFLGFFFLGFLSRWAIGSFSEFNLNLGQDLKVFFWAMQFDLAAAGFFTIVWALVMVLAGGKKFSQNFTLWVLAFLYFLMASADYLYIQESGRHLGYEVVNLFSIQSSLLDLFRKYIWFLILSICGSFLWLKIYSAKKDIKNGWFKRAMKFLVILIPCFICVRGFRGIPLDPSYAYRAGSPREANLSLNPAYSILYSAFSGYQVKPESILVPEGLDTHKIYTQWKADRGVSAPQFQHRGNIVFVFLEGWPAVRLPTLFKEYMAQNALTAELFLASGHRTVEGIFASLCSFTNPLGRGIMFSQLENMPYYCLPQALREQGYATAFFQGSDQLTSGVGPLAQKIGFSESFGKRDLPGAMEKEHNFWGLYDQDLYKYAEAHLEKMQEPFFIGINTNTTHDLKLPTNVEWSKGQGTQAEKHSSVLAHADKELNDFLLRMSKRKFQLPVTWVFVADHTAYVEGSFLDHYAIPFAIVSPYVKPQRIERVATQKDIAATLADLFGVRAPHYLGQSLLQETTAYSADLYHLGLGVWFENEWAVVFNVRKPNEYSCYRWRTDWNLVSKLPCPEGSEQMYHRGLSFLVESQKALFAGETAKSR